MRRHLILASTVVVALSLAACGQAPEQVSTAPEAVETTTTAPPGPTAAEVARWEAELDRQEWNTAAWVHRTNENTWIERTNERLAAERAERERQEAAERTSVARPASVPSSGRCGGDLPPCCVMMRESGGSLTAQNPTSTASGKWQFINGTWGGYGGYAEAWMAPESVQDARARELWAGGAGASHWGGGC